MEEVIDFREIFCGVCGTFFDLRQNGTHYTCRKCGTMKTCAGTRLMFTRSIAEYPLATAWLEKELAAHEPVDVHAQRALVSEECGKCKHPKMYFWTQQLRSADEGQTVFYECPNCNNRLSINS